MPDTPADLNQPDKDTIEWTGTLTSGNYELYLNAEGTPFAVVAHDALPLQHVFASTEHPDSGDTISIIANDGVDSSSPATLTWARPAWGDPGTGSHTQLDENTLRIGGWGGSEPDFPDVKVKKNGSLVTTITDYDSNDYDYDFALIEDGDEVTIIFTLQSEGYDDSPESTVLGWVISGTPTLGGTNTGSVTENAATTTTSGTLTITDADSGQAQYQTLSTTGTYGSFTLGTNGVWTYTLNNSDSNTNNLSSGQTVTDTFVATSNDASASQNVTITITGASDTALLGGTNTGTVVKGAAISTTAGTLTITDPDSGQQQYQTRSTTGTYGTFTLGTSGAWTYTLNNSDADTLALTSGQIVTDVFVATSNDGAASQNVTITVRQSSAGSFDVTLAQKRFHLLIR